jgi:Uma2 family endonuclease
VPYYATIVSYILFSVRLAMQSPTLTNSLDSFLQQPNIEASPAWEFIQGQAQQKPMPTLFHSLLQRDLVNAVNQQTAVYEAIQELRCVVPPMSPVPDIAIVKSDRLGNEDGPLQGAPDWLIEIRSPDQSTLDLQSKILHCLSNGTKLAWLIDIQRKQIWVWQNQELPLIYAGTDVLPSLDNILELTVDSVIAMTQR